MTITDRDSAEAADYGIPPNVIAVAREQKALVDAAWGSFLAYTERADHDIRSEEYRRLRDAFLVAQTAWATAECAVTEAIRTVEAARLHPDWPEGSPSADEARKAVCPRCLDPGTSGGTPKHPHPGPFTNTLCPACERATEQPR